MHYRLLVVENSILHPVYSEDAPYRSSSYEFISHQHILSPSLLSGGYLAQRKNELSSLHVPPTYRIRQADVPRSFGETNQQRIGGMCVHRHDNVRNMEAISEQQQPVLSNGAFCQEMISRYGSSSSSSNNKIKRGRKKRAATAITMTDAAEEWTSCPALTRHTSNYYAAARMLFPHDEEARLQQLENDFGGNVDIAELDMRVRLTNGTGTFTYFACGHGMRHFIRLRK